jgi:hypothetical protein
MSKKPHYDELVKLLLIGDSGALFRGANAVSARTATVPKRLPALRSLRCNRCGEVLLAATLLRGRLPSVVHHHHWY